jgi:MtrB/PioB family decaheme-associated outer membrane protein
MTCRTLHSFSPALGAWLALVAAAPATAAAPAAPAAADTPPDTSEWKCAQCPFLAGYATDTEAGVQYASGANAAFGRYTGIDHTGPYADAAASGQARADDGAYADYDLERLGLASRDGFVEGGREGRYDVRISYDGQPTRLYDTPRLESDRRTVALLARYFVSPSWTLFGEYRRQEQDGTGLTSASFLTEAVQLPLPQAYVTNSFEAGAAWAGRHAGLRLTYTGSWFSDENDSLLFANPYPAIVPGSTQGQLADPPGNDLQQLAAAGNLELPWFATTLTSTASIGTLRQDQSFLPVSTLATANVLGETSLGGDVHLSHYALGVASRPLGKLALRGNAAYDGRDDKTPVRVIPYIATDTFPGGTALTPRYSEDRVRLDGGADYSWTHWLHIGVGGKFNDTHYGPGQVYTNTQETQSWGRATVIPAEALSITLKVGDGLRKASSFDAAAVPLQESPLLRDYNYAPRDQTFSTLTATWSVTATLTWTAQGSLTKDDFRSSPLGLLADHAQRASSTLAWTPRETQSVYVDVGYQHLSTLQSGSTGTATSPWFAAETDRFWNLSVGGHWVPQERWTLSLDYLVAPSYSDTDTTAAGLQQGFPQNWTRLDSTRFGVLYRWTPALQLRLRYTRETYHSNDWGLEGVGPATVPNYLALGLQPYRDNVNMVGVTMRYQFGRDSAPAGAR